jgi:YVTN family beta-propeller protein
VVAKIQVPHASGALAAGLGAVWAMKDDGKTLYRIDPKQNSVVAQIDLGMSEPCPAPPQSCGEVAVGVKAVWVVEPAAGVVARIDAQTNAVVARIPVSDQPAGVTVWQGAVWVASLRRPSITRIDPTTNKVVSSTAVGRAKPCCGSHITVAGGDGDLWVTLEKAGAVARLDPTSKRISRISMAPLRFGQPCGGLLVTRKAVWVGGAHCPTSSGYAVVIRIDPHKKKIVGAVKHVQSPIGLALAAGSLWVADLDAKSLERVDPASGRVVGKLRVGGVPIGLVRGSGALWLGDAGGRVLRIAPAHR